MTKSTTQGEKHMSKILIDEATVKLALEALDPFTTPNWPDYISEDKANAAYTALREALAEQPDHHDPIGEAQDKLIAEQAAQAQPAREPLTNLEGLKLAYNHHWLNNRAGVDAYLLGIRDAEAAHGIEEKNT